MNMERLHRSPSDTNHDYATFVEAISGYAVIINVILVMKGMSYFKK